MLYNGICSELGHAVALFGLAMLGKARFATTGAAARCRAITGCLPAPRRLAVVSGLGNVPTRAPTLDSRALCERIVPDSAADDRRVRRKLDVEP